MRRAEIITLVTIFSILWLSAGAIVTQKVYYNTFDGGCKSQPVLVPVVLNKNCVPTTVMVRSCNKASEDYKINCKGN